MDTSLLNSIITLISFVIFLGIIYWAYAGKNKQKFEAIGRSLLEIDTEKTEK